MSEQEETPMTKTKEKILFETQQLVLSLNTQMAVMTTSNNELKEAIKTYIDKAERRMDRIDEKDANLDQRTTILRNDLTKLEGRVDGLTDGVRDLKADQTMFKWINVVITAVMSAIASAIAYYLGHQ